VGVKDIAKSDDGGGKRARSLWHLSASSASFIVTFYFVRFSTWNRWRRTWKILSLMKRLVNLLIQYHRATNLVGIVFSLMRQTQLPRKIPHKS
jgi:hypothetical protein